jgi:hypothetical protein
MERSLVGLAVRIDKTAALQENPKKITLRRRDRRGKEEHRGTEATEMNWARLTC